MEDDGLLSLDSIVHIMRQGRWQEMYKHFSINKDEELEMSYYVHSTRDGEVAKAALKALEDGISLDQLLRKNNNVRVWWNAHLHEREAERRAAEKEKIRRQKAAEKRKLDEARRQEALAKLTPEEIEAFGLTKKVTKR